MTIKWQDWYAILPPELLQAAYKSTSELAWPEKQALRVNDLLDANGYLILGVEAWLPTHPGPTPLPYLWDKSKHSQSTKVPNTPEKFIQQYEVLHGDKPVFNFCVKDK